LIKNKINMTDWPATFKCNDNCISCINNTEIVSRIPDPPLEQIKSVIDSINPKNDYFGIGGGEPTLRKEFFDILEYARKKHPNLYIFVTTNGRMFSYKNFAKKFADLKLGDVCVAVALYGHNPEIHESVTRTKDSFEQTIKGIKNLISLGIRTEIRTIINLINYKHMEDLTKFVVKEFPSLDRFVFINMKITGNAYKNKNSVLVKISDVIPHVEKAVKVLKDSGIQTRLYHFPLCIVPRHLQNLAKGITKTEIQELTFVEECKKCKMRKECSMIWKSYAAIMGDEEFKAIVD